MSLLASPPPNTQAVVDGTLHNFYNSSSFLKFSSVDIDTYTSTTCNLYGRFIKILVEFRPADCKKIPFNATMKVKIFFKGKTSFRRLPVSFQQFSQLNNKLRDFRNVSSHETCHSFS